MSGPSHSSQSVAAAGQDATPAAGQDATMFRRSHSRSRSQSVTAAGQSAGPAMDLAINFAAVPLFREPAKQRDIRTVRQADGFGDVCVWDVEDPWDKDRAVWIPNGAQVEVLREYWDTSGSQVKMERKQFYLITVTRGKYAWQKGRTGRSTHGEALLPVPHQRANPHWMNQIHSTVSPIACSKKLRARPW